MKFVFEEDRGFFYDAVKMDEAKHKAQEIGMDTLEWTRRIITLD